MEQKIGYVALTIALVILIWMIVGDHSMEKCLETFSQATCNNQLR